MAEIREIYFLTVLEAGKSKIKFQQGLVSGEGSLPGLQMATFSLCSDAVESENSLVSFSLYKASALWDQSPTLMTSFKLNDLLIGPSPSTLTLTVRASTYDSGDL